MITAKQQKLKEELKKKHQDKLLKTNEKPKKQDNIDTDICEADCICEDIKAKHDNEAVKIPTSKLPFTFSKNPLANSMLVGDILATPAFRKNYKR